jgi:hypothetical protein
VGYLSTVTQHPDNASHEPGQPPIEIQPLDVDGVRTVTVGAILWLVAFVLLLPFYGELEEAGRLWWLWTCLAGFGLGMYGIEHCRRRRNRNRNPGGRRMAG